MKVGPPTPAGSAARRSYEHKLDGASRKGDGSPQSGPRSPGPESIKEPSVQPVSDWAQFSPQQRRSIFIVACVQLFLGQLGFAIFAPFFPQEAAAKGVSTTMLGFIFGIFQLVVVAFTPITLWLLPRLGCTTLLNISNVLCGVSSLVFGVTWYVSAGRPFIVMCFASRVVAGAGVSMQFQLIYGMLPCLFEESVSTSASIVETVIGVAFMTAPLIGSGLYVVFGGDSGSGFGYVGPFLVLGTAQSLFAVFMLCWFPRLPTGESGGSTLGGFSRHGVLAFVVSIVNGAATEYCGPSLQPFLVQAPFAYSISMVGLVFAVMSVVYGICGPLVGRLDDHYEGRRCIPIMLFGTAVTGIGYIALAPAAWLHPWLPLEVGPLPMWAGVVLIGFGTSFGIIPSYGSLYACAEHSSSSERSNAAAALFNVSYGMGAFLGPTLGGILTDAVGVESSYSGYGFFCIAAAGLFGLVECACGRRGPLEATDGLEPLLA